MRKLIEMTFSTSHRSYISLEGNLFSLRSIGYFMTAIMERQNNKALTPLAILHMQDNEGVIQAIESDVQPTSQEVSVKFGFGLFDMIFFYSVVIAYPS